MPAPAARFCRGAACCALLLPLFHLSSAVTAPTPQATASSTRRTPVGDFAVVHEFPHDPQAFCQGLVVWNGFFYESTGLYGQSTVRKVDIATGRVLKTLRLAPEFFGEGLTIFRGKIYQLTWKTKVGFIYDPETFQSVGAFHYDWEGWGLTHDDRYLIASDGSDKLRFLDPATFQIRRTISVTDEGRPLDNLNELEYIDGEIYSNRWHDNRIARIDPHSGKVIAWIDLSKLVATMTLGPEDVLNGIAYDDPSKRLFITGKHWPKMFEIRLKKP